MSQQSTEEINRVSSSEVSPNQKARNRSSRSQWLIWMSVLAVMIGIGISGYFIYQSWATPPVSSNAQQPENKFNRPFGITPSVMSQNLARAVGKFSFPEIVSHKPIKPSELPQDVATFAQVDAQSVTVESVLFADKSTGFVISYLYPTSIENSFADFYDKFGAVWVDVAGSRTDDAAFIDRMKGKSQMRISLMYVDDNHTQVLIQVQEKQG
jgi:hypothetical protein